MLLGARADDAALQLVPFSLGIPLGAYVGGRLSAHTGRFKPIQLCGAVCVPIAMLGLIFIDAHAIGGNLFCVALVRSEEHTSELQSLMRISYAVFCLKKK